MGLLMAETATDLEPFLDKLDLSSAEKKVYAFLLRGKSSKASEISRALGISTTNVYPIVNQLVEKGLVEASVARPITFVAVPLERAYSQFILKYQKEMNDKLSDLRKARGQLEDVLKTQEVQSGLFEKDKFQIIKGFNNSASRMLSALSKAEREVQLAMRRERTLELDRIGFFDVLKNIQDKRGFQARLLLDRDLRKFIRNLGKNVHVKWVKTEAIANEVLIADDEAFYSLRDDRDLQDILFFWTNFAKFRLMCSRVFQDLWKPRITDSEGMSASDLAVESGLVNLLEACGLHISKGDKIVGVSGAEYIINFALKMPETEKPIVLDIISSKTADDNSLIRLSIKAFDIQSRVSRSVLLVLGKLDTTVKMVLDEGSLKIVDVAV